MVPTLGGVVEETLVSSCQRYVDVVVNAILMFLRRKGRKSEFHGHRLTVCLAEDGDNVGTFHVGSGDQGVGGGDIPSLIRRSCELIEEIL